MTNSLNHTLRPIPMKPKFQVLHLDHDKSYFDKEINIINTNIHRARVSRGLESALAEDKLGWENVD